MKPNSQALKQESNMENMKPEKKSNKSTAHVRKIQPVKTKTATPNDPGCRPIGT